MADGFRDGRQSIGNSLGGGARRTGWSLDYWGIWAARSDSPNQSSTRSRNAPGEFDILQLILRRLAFPVARNGNEVDNPGIGLIEEMNGAVVIGLDISGHRDRRVFRSRGLADVYVVADNRFAPPVPVEE